MNFRDWVVATTAAVLAALITVAPASATTIELAFGYDTLNGSGQSVVVQGDLFVNESQPVTINDVQGYAISSITGTRTVGASPAQSISMVGVGGAVQSIITFDPAFANPLKSNLNFDNTIYNPTTSSSPVDGFGWEFTTANGSPVGNGNIYNVWFDAVSGEVYNNQKLTTNGYLTPVPLPGALPMFGSVIAGFGVAVRRRARKAV